MNYILWTIIVIKAVINTIIMINDKFSCNVKLKYTTLLYNCLLVVLAICHYFDIINVPFLEK